MTIVGIDPGLLVTGYGIIRESGRAWEFVGCGSISPPPQEKIENRYLMICDGVDHLLEIHSPEAVVVETQFVHKNPRSALKLGMACGAVMIAAARRGVAVFEYAPTKAKIAVVGRGNASKLQVQQMVKIELRLSKLPEPTDAADALALALCHAYNRGCRV